MQAKAYLYPACSYLLIPLLACLLYNIPNGYTGSYYGRLYFLGLLVSSSYWLVHPLHEMVGLPWWLAITVLTAAFCLAATIFDGGFIIKSHSPNWLSYAWITACSEYLRQGTFLALPWSFTGYISMHLPLVSLIPYTSVFTLSYLLIHSINAIAMVCKKPLEGIIHYSILLAILSGLFQLLPAVITHTQGTLPVQIIQPNIKLETKQHPHQVSSTLSTLLTQADPEALSILPEAAIHLNTDTISLSDFKATLAKRSSLIGLSYHQPPHYENYISIIATGKAEGMYHKQRRVPFGEMIPSLDSIYPIITRVLTPPPVLEALHTPTNIPTSTLLKYKNYYLYPILCYEVFFPIVSSKQQAKASANIISAENNFYSDSQLHLMLNNAARFQAIQSAKTTLLATNRGPSTIYDKFGNIQAQSAFNTTQLLTSQVTLNNTQNLYHSGYDSVIIILLLVIDWLSYQCRTIMVYYARQLFSQRHRTTSQTSMA